MQATARKRLQARLGRGDGWTALRMEGVIDEHNGLDQLAKTLSGSSGTLVLDLAGIRRINSVGVRDWVLWLRQLREQFDHVVLTQCTPSIMNEVNLVRNFAEGAIIASFQAPYYCDLCNKEGVELLDPRAMMAAGDRKAPSVVCDKSPCGYTLDDDEATYFAFFDDQTDLAAPADLNAILAAVPGAFDDAGAEVVELTSPDAPSTPARRSLSSIGGPARAFPSIERPLPLPPPPSTSTDLGGSEGRQDFVFLALIVAMVGVLGVLVYLITTLE